MSDSHGINGNNRKWTPTEEELRDILQKHSKFQKWWAPKVGEHADLSRANLSGANLRGAKLQGANLSGARLWQVDLAGADLRAADLSEASLNGADLPEADLRAADLQGAKLRTTDLSGAALSSADLSGAYLTRANLSEAALPDVDLSGAGLEKANLWCSQLRDACLKRTRFQDATLWGADLTGANLQEANLQNADLGGTDGLQAGAVARANASNATLPDDVAEFDGLEVVAEASSGARKLFIAIGLACAYSALAISTTSASEGTLLLPFVDVEISVGGFYVVVPVLLALAFGYFHLQMQRVWEEVGMLPAVFPDGKAVDRKIQPWLITGLARAHFPYLREDPVPLFPLQKWVVIGLAWGTVPLTQAYFVGRFVMQEQFNEYVVHSGGGAALVALTIGGAVVSYQTAKAHLRGEYKRPLRPFTGLFEKEEREDVRRWPDGHTVFLVIEWMLATFALWIWWTFVWLDL